MLLGRFLYENIELGNTVSYKGFETLGCLHIRHKSQWPSDALKLMHQIKGEENHGMDLSPWANASMDGLVAP